MNYRVGIYDADTAYVKALMNYLNAKEKIPITLYAFSSPESLAAGAEDNRLSMLLIGEAAVIPEGIDACMTLCESARPKPGSCAVYKYQSADALATQILTFIRAQAKTVRAESGLVIACISPYGSSGKSTLAMGLCKSYAPSLYVNMEELQPPECMEELTRKRCERLLYYIVSKNPEMSGMVTSREQEGFDRLLDGSSFSEFRQLMPEHISELIKTIRDTDRYQRIVFDIGLGSLSSWQLLSLFDRVYITLPDGRDTAKRESFCRELIHACGESVKKHLQFVKVPQTSWSSAALAEWIEVEGL